MPPATDPAQTDQNAAQASETPEYATKEELSNVVNAAVASHLKRHLGSAIAAVISKELEPIKQRLAEPPKEAEGKTEPEAKKPSPEYQALQKQLADMQAALRAKDEEAASERKRAREDKAFAELVTELTGKVRPGAEKQLAKLIRADGQLMVDDDGNPVMKVRTALHKGAQEMDHEFPLSDGVKHYLKTQDAALFLPPPNSGGAGGDRRVPAQQPQAASRPAMPRYDSAPMSEEENARRTAEQLAAMGLSLADL